MKTLRQRLRKLLAPGPTWQYRLLVFAGEVLIIGVGIALGLAVENYKEDLERKEKSLDLLVSLHEELGRDVLELMDDSTAMHQKVQAYRGFFKLGAPDATFDAEFLAANTWTLASTTTFIPNTSVFEVIKAHGGLEIWDDNHHVLREIFSLYQEQVPMVQMSNKVCNELLQQDLTPYLRQHIQLNNKGEISNLQKVMQVDYCRVVMMNLADYSQEAEYRYGATIKAYKKLMSTIEKEVGSERLKATQSS